MDDTAISNALSKLMQADYPPKATCRPSYEIDVNPMTTLRDELLTELYLRLE